MARLRDDGRLRNLKPPVAPQILAGVLIVRIVIHGSHPESLVFGADYRGLPPRIITASGGGWPAGGAFGRLARMYSIPMFFFSCFYPTPQAVGRR